MTRCECGSYAINHHCHGRDGSDENLCDVCYWRKRAELAQAECRKYKLVGLQLAVSLGEKGKE